MKVIPIKGQSAIFPGQGIDIYLQDGTTIKAILEEGKIFPAEQDGVFGEIREKEYTVGNEDKILSAPKQNPTYHPLEGHGILCYLENGKAIPVLRESRGRERNVFKTWKTDIHKQNKLEGPECPFWPVIN